MSKKPKLQSSLITFFQKKSRVASTEERDSVIPGSLERDNISLKTTLDLDAKPSDPSLDIDDSSLGSRDQPGSLHAKSNALGSSACLKSLGVESKSDSRDPANGFGNISVAIGPYQPLLQYPVTIVQGKSRSLNANWYKTYIYGWSTAL